MISIEHLRKEYPNAVPLKDVSLTVNRGDVISVIGPSGTGKSTLLRCINMLDVPTSGRIIIDGEEITRKGARLDLLRKKMGMVFQSFTLFEHLTVIENLMLAPMDLLGRSRQEAYDRGMELLQLVGLGTKGMNYPDQLSGGQKQRVAIARALAMDPQIILFDEPTSALDPTMVGEVQKVIRNLARKGLTMMIVTHDMRFAREIATRVLYMDQGGIYEEGTPEEIFDTPRRENTRRFIHRQKSFELLIERRAFDLPDIVRSIDEFGLKNLISAVLVRRFHAVFEELAVQILLEENGIMQLSLTAEYDEEREEIDLTLRYDGKAFDPSTTENRFAWKIVNGYGNCYSWEQIPKDDFTNAVTLKIR